MKRLILGVSCGIVGFTALSSFRTIPAGHVGFKNLFGKVSDHQYQSGFCFINPVSKIIVFDLRKQKLHSEPIVTSNEGLDIGADIDVVYRLEQKHAKDVYLGVGKNYDEIILIPQLRSIIRNVISGYEAKALYDDKIRTEIRNKILNELVLKMGDSGIIIDDVLMNKINLPTNLKNAIEDKLKAEQEMQKVEFVINKQREEMKFILEKESMEADRKKIEAEGIKTFQDIVSKGISPDMLQWKAISATEELSKSPNSKIVMLGNKAGLSVMLDSK